MNRGRPAEKGTASEPAPKRARGGKGRAGSGAMEGLEGGATEEPPQVSGPAVARDKQVMDVLGGWVDGRGAYSAVLQLYALGLPLEPSGPLLKTLWACLEHEKAQGPRVRGLSALLQCYPSLFEHMVGFHVQRLLSGGEAGGGEGKEPCLRVLSKYCWAHLNTLLSLHNGLTHTLTLATRHAANGPLSEGVRRELCVLLEDATRKRYGKHSPLRCLIRGAASHPPLLLPLLAAFTHTTGTQEEYGGDGVAHLQRLWGALTLSDRTLVLHTLKWTPDTIAALAPLAAQGSRAELGLVLDLVCGLGVEGVMGLSVGVLRSAQAHEGGAALLLVALLGLANSTNKSALGPQGDGLALVCSKLVSLLLDKDDSVQLQPPPLPQTEPRSALASCGTPLLARLLQALTSQSRCMYQGREREVMDLVSRVVSQLAHTQQRHQPTPTLGPTPHPSNNSNSNSSSGMRVEEGSVLEWDLRDASVCMVVVDWGVGLAVEVASLLSLTKAIEEAAHGPGERDEAKREHERRLAAVVDRAVSVLLTVASVSPILPKDWLLSTLSTLCGEERFMGPLVTSQAQHADCLDDCVLSRPQRLLVRLQELRARVPAFYDLLTQGPAPNPTTECVVCYEPGALAVACSRVPQPCLNLLCAQCLWRKLFGPEPSHSFSCVVCRGSSPLSIYRLPSSGPAAPPSPARPRRPPAPSLPPPHAYDDESEDEPAPPPPHPPHLLPHNLPQGLAQVLQLAASGGGGSLVLHGDGPPPDLLRLFAQLGPPPLPAFQMRREQLQGARPVAGTGGALGGGRCPHGPSTARLHLNGPPQALRGLPSLGLAAIRLEVQQEGSDDDQDEEQGGDY